MRAWKIIRLVSLATSLGCLVLAILIVISARGSRAWPTARASITSTKVSSFIQPAPHSWYSRATTHSIRRIHATYTYEVDGNRYEGAGLVPNREQTITVFYAPSNPAISTPTPGVDWGAFVASLLAAGLAFIVSRFATGAMSQGAAV